MRHPLNDAEKRHSKARTLSLLMREAAVAGVSPTAQAILAILIAEAWPVTASHLWRCRLSQARLATRISRHTDTVKRAIDELRKHQLVIVRPGRVRSVSQYLIDPLRGCTGAGSEGAPVRGQRGHGCAPIQDQESLQDSRDERIAQIRAWAEAKR